MDLTIPHLIFLASQWGYLFLVLTSFILGPLIAVIAGILVSLGSLNWWWAFVALTVGDLVGDFIYYALGRYGQGKWSERVMEWFGFTKSRRVEFDKVFERHAIKILLINKTQAIGSVALIYAGVIKMNIVRYFRINLLGTLPKVALFMVIGYYFGNLAHLDRFVHYTEYFSLLIPLSMLIGYWYLRRKSRLKMDSEK
jgi:membrane protein DedA with SNARE-associated domain